MKGILREYTGALLGFVGSVCVLSVARQFFLGNNNLFARLIIAVVQGAL